MDIIIIMFKLTYKQPLCRSNGRDFDSLHKLWRRLRKDLCCPTHRRTRLGRTSPSTYSGACWLHDTSPAQTTCTPYPDKIKIVT